MNEVFNPNAFFIGTLLDVKFLRDIIKVKCPVLSLEFPTAKELPCTGLIDQEEDIGCKWLWPDEWYRNPYQHEDSTFLVLFELPTDSELIHIEVAPIGIFGAILIRVPQSYQDNNAILARMFYTNFIRKVGSDIPAMKMKYVYDFVVQERLTQTEKKEPAKIQ